ncbi:MAG: cell division protein ZapA [Gemmatimonadota bacterium]|nr:cell division protein ZapA [Gemmatimonadota bacterium]
MSGKKTSVKVEILGESYVLRTEAAPEHTRAVAEHLDKSIRQILSGGAVIEANRAAILAALQITSELFMAREANGALIGSMQGLALDIRRLLPPAKRDSVGVPAVGG